MNIDIYRSGLRDYLKDYEELNRILKFEEENSNDKLDLYLYMAIGFLNSVPPPVAVYTIESFPMPGMLIHRAIIECLISNSILQARNELSYNNGGISVKVPDGNRYANQIQMLLNIFNQDMEMLRQMKISMNIDAGWGGLNSPYHYIAGYPFLKRPYDGLN
jgi:hypothetical protein